MDTTTSNTPGFKLSALHHHVDREQETNFGFWLFLMSDAIIFGVIFATYAAMLGGKAGGPGPKQLFDISSVGGADRRAAAEQLHLRHGLAVAEVQHGGARC